MGWDERERQVAAMLPAYVRECLRDIWDRQDLVTDADGDFPYRWGTAMCWVHVHTGETPSVRVFGHAATGLRRSAKLLAEVNDVNVRSRWSRVVLSGGVVEVSYELPWTVVDRDSLEQALQSVGVVSDDIGLPIAAVFGGRTPFPQEEAEDETGRTEPGAA